MFYTYSLELIKEKQVNYPDKSINAPEDIAAVLKELRLHKQPEEHLIVLALDTKHKVIGSFEVSIGTINSAIIHPREVFKRLLLCNSASFAMAHNHPSGNVNPSPEDIAATNRLRDAGRLLGIDLIDHVIIGDDDYTSLRATGVCEF